MIIKAQGLCHFHFWGTYSQSFSLCFSSLLDAQLALPVLQKLQTTEQITDACGRAVLSRGWFLAQDPKTVDRVFIIAHVGGDDAGRFEEQLVSLGANPEKIGSLAFSCDHGEVFEVTIDVNDPAQSTLELNSNN